MVNARVLRAIEESGVSVQCVDVSQAVGIPKLKLEYHLARAKKVWKAAGLVLSENRQQRLYCVLEAGWGMFYTILLIALARISRRETILHHHSAGHLARFSIMFWLIARLGGRTTTHVVLCDRMQMDLIKLYKLSHSMVCWNAAVMPERTKKEPFQNAHVILGHLSNLCSDKGISEVIEVFRRLTKSGRSAELILAGPIADLETQKAIQTAREEFGERVIYKGPVFGDAKDEFYRTVDVFLFPSRFKIEAQPVVILEALSYGVPCVTSPQGYIRDMMDDCGLCIPLDDYVEAGANQISLWIDSPSELTLESAKAQRRFQRLHQLAILQERQLVAVLTGSSARI